ncbi:gamma-glutamyl-gamma-aminobutyrate hydrolase family protein [Candidatus Saccharibacteria bacterium]|nr:MAG: gamma-glutamyl-gamma-aminobutyrate hydrolase family protein [Candidatus Saccharibacteria bacterium]
MRRKVIGITPAFDEGQKLPDSKASVYLRREYVEHIAAAGATPIILVPDMHPTTILDLCDGLIISGGEDIPAELQGRDELCSVSEPLERVMWERQLIKSFSALRKPVLGICYGMQLLALHYGGSLYQDINQEVEGSIEHVLVRHSIEMKHDFLGLKQNEHVLVNSRHHQAVADLPKDFIACAVAPDGIIEAMQHKSIFGVQWHPESDVTGELIYSSFIGHCQS